jgi:hypothetical protein
VEKPTDKRSRLKAFVAFLRRRFGRKPPSSPSDPYAYVTAPLRRGPKGRSGAAVAEMEDDSFEAYPPRKR